MKAKYHLILIFTFSVLTNTYAQDAYRNYKWGMTVAEVAKNSERLLPVNSVTRFSDAIFDIIAYTRNYVIDGKIIRPNIFNNRVVQKLQFLNNFLLKLQNTQYFA
jgi:hypothetical protein